MVSIAKTTQTQYIYENITKDVQITYKNNDQFNSDRNNTYDFLPIFQSVCKLLKQLQNQEMIYKRNKNKYNIQQNQNQDDSEKKTIKQIYQNIAQLKYQQVLERLLQQQQSPEEILQNNFKKYQEIKSQFLGKLFRIAYDFKFHDMLNFRNIIKRQYKKHMWAAHMAVFFGQLRMNKSQRERVAQLKINQQIYLQQLNMY
ncbi:unnamed protein product [Paramecium sonneborni]|uniref:Uncharacterized protein n=1 Tax=Paramecium sonneborni TaxID=65129 RepID=A0A8S1NWX8_9CILI|nr:unnamed protein product [Paramecium sonneborni]